MSRLTKWLGIAGAAMILAACGASTTVQTMWTDETYKPDQAPFKKVLIMGVYQQKSNGLAFEAEMKKQFVAKGIEAQGSFDAFPAGGEITKDQLVDYLKSNAYDAVLLSQLTEKKTEIDYQPGYTYMGGYYGYYSGAYGMAYSSPGYVTQYDVLTIESTLFAVDGEKMVWVGSSEVFDPSNAMDAIKSFCPAVVGTLVGKKYFVGSSK